MRFLRTTLTAASASVIMALLFASVAFAGSPADLSVRRIGNTHVATLTKGDTIEVKYLPDEICHTQVKTAENISRTFGADPQDVYRDGGECFNSFVTDEVPSLRYMYRSSTLIHPDEFRVWTRGNWCCGANEALILYQNRASGWHSVGIPPKWGKIKTLEDLAFALTGSRDTYCFREKTDDATGETYYTYGQQCEAIHFELATAWFVDDELTPDFMPNRGPGALVSSAKFKIYRARTVAHRWVYNQVQAIRRGEDVDRATKRIVQRYAPVWNKKVPTKTDQR